MLELQNIPKTNEFGLVLPPAEIGLPSYLPYRRGRNRPDYAVRHHLYWPRLKYREQTEHDHLASRFREHPFNSVWLLESDHVAWHNIYDGVPVPPVEIMEAFLVEAHILEELQVCVKAVDMINAALYEGKIEQVRHAEEYRQRRVEALGHTVEQCLSLEILNVNVVEPGFERVFDLLTAA